MTDADLLRCIEAVDKRKQLGSELGGRGNQYTGGKASGDALPQKSAEVTAKIVGTSTRKVEKARTVIDASKSDPSIKEEVLKGKKSINMAATECRIGFRFLGLSRGRIGVEDHNRSRSGIGSPIVGRECGCRGRILGISQDGLRLVGATLLALVWLAVLGVKSLSI